MSKRLAIFIFIFSITTLLVRPSLTESLPQVAYPEFAFPSAEFLPDPEIIAADIPSAEVEGIHTSNPVPIHYGVNFMSSAEYPSNTQRYNDALATGAKWNRLPLYWHSIEQSSDNYTWSAHDPVIIADIEKGLLTNAILMGVPGFYFTNGKAIPNTLYQPIFSDGTDIPGAGKTININNKWARFTYAIVNRYKPGGEIAQQRGWPANAGVWHWEMWNEPDLTWFWEGTKADYARLLKVGYLSAKHAHPGMQIIFGGIANNYGDLNYYKDVLTHLRDTDSRAPIHEFYHTIFATHSYFNSWQSWYHVYRARNTMGGFGLDKPIWLNESGVPAWNDYPGPNWDPQSPYRATLNEQADYVWQSAFYALYAGADAVFNFQLYDGCGNQPQGTDFPPHTGNLCRSDGMLISDPSKPCAGDAFGMITNYTDAACFRQHPQKGQRRPQFKAFKLLTDYLQDAAPLYRERTCTADGQSWISFYRPNTNQRIMALWACTNRAEDANIPAIGDGALLVSSDGTSQYINHTNGNYYVRLAGATNNHPLDNPNQWPIGGKTYLLIERDLQAPTATLAASKSGANVTVSWSGSDGRGGGIASFDVKVSVDEGVWQNWLIGTTQTAATYTGSYRSSVRFTVTAKDRAGNVSRPTEKRIGGSTTPLPPTIRYTLDRTEVSAGQTLVYQLTVSNPANNGALEIALKAPLSTAVLFVDGSLWQSKGSADFLGDAIHWNGSLAEGETLTIGWRATVNSSSWPRTLFFSAELQDNMGRTIRTTTTTDLHVNGLRPPKLYLPIIRR